MRNYELVIETSVLYIKFDLFSSLVLTISLLIKFQYLFTKRFVQLWSKIGSNLEWIHIVLTDPESWNSNELRMRYLQNKNHIISWNVQIALEIKMIQ